MYLLLFDEIDNFENIVQDIYLFDFAILLEIIYCIVKFVQMRKNNNKNKENAKNVDENYCYNFLLLFFDFLDIFNFETQILQNNAID